MFRRYIPSTARSRLEASLISPFLLAFGNTTGFKIPAEWFPTSSVVIGKLPSDTKDRSSGRSEQIWAQNANDEVYREITSIESNTLIWFVIEFQASFARC